MKKTIEFYEMHNLDTPYIPERNADLEEVLKLIPEPARARSMLTSLINKPSLWFHKDSTIDEIKITPDRDEAISATSIVPSFVSYANWIKTGIPSADIELYEIPAEAGSEKARKVVEIEGLIHELGHTIVNCLLYPDGQNDPILRLPDGRDVDAFDYVMEFANMAEEIDPISHYASFYRGEDNKFKDTEKVNIITSISEEFTESIAAYILGFAYCGDENRSLNPFEDRLEIKKHVEYFLNGELVNKE